DKKQLGDVNSGPGGEGDGKVFTYVEQMPVFPGGEAALNKFIHDHLKYPAVSLEEGVQGVVMLRFVVNENGSVGDVQILKSLDTYCDREAKRVVQSLPRFTPGRQQGKPVKVWFQFPIRFEIQ
ncbi:MAG: energy transducer TonB, partial [Bacteroidaceae bacterium]|nr:energy transducer TonB [Bacteroidaceae bacterium]